MTDWYAPNQQAVGTSPAAGGAARTASTQESAAVYDPGEETVDDVKAYVDANPDQRRSVLKAERKGKNRTTLTDWLEAQPG